MCPPRSALTLAALMVLGSAAVPAVATRAQATESAFCLDVHKLDGMQAAAFVGVRGPADGPPSDDGFQFYDTPFKLPGAETCKVWFDLQDRGWGYDCSWRVADPASGERQFTTLTDGIASCYPHARTDRPWAGRFSIDEPHIKIRIRGTGRLSGIVLTLSSSQ